ncbi:MAG: lamin tail domain-containing protein [Carbonactinosporaceae bacterium]
MKIRSLILAGLLAGSVVVVAAPAEAAPQIKIHKVYFNSPGDDTGSNRSLNAEFITLKNTGTTKRSLRGWSVRDGAGFTYSFGRYTLRPGAYVTIHTGRGDDTRRHRYWDRDWYVWNNTGDTAKLRRPDGTRVDTCSWNGSGSVKRC